MNLVKRENVKRNLTSLMAQDLGPFTKGRETLTSWMALGSADISHESICIY